MNAHGGHGGPPGYGGPPGGYGPPGGGYGPPGGGYGPPGGGYGYGGPPAGGPPQGGWGPPGPGGPGWGAPPPHGGPPPHQGGAPPAKKRNWGLIVLIGAVVAFGSCITCGVIVSPSEEEAKELEVERKPIIENATQRFAGIRNAMPDPSSLREARCPDAAIAAATSEAPHHYVDYDHLETFTNPAFDPTAEPFAKWKFMSSSGVRDIRTTASLKKADQDLSTIAAKNVVDPILEIDRAKTLIVIRARKVLPQVASETSFAGGEIDGFAVVYDWINMKPLCQASLQVRNSDVVEFKKRGIGKSTFEEAVMDDLEENYEKNLKEALARISGKVQPAL